MRTTARGAVLEPVLDTTFDPPGMIHKVLTDRDDDLVIWGASFGENFDGNYLGALRTCSTAGAAAPSGYSNPKMDAAVESMRTASTDAAPTAAYEKLQGVTMGDNSTFLLEKAWLER